MPQQLPKIQTDDRILSMLQSQWKAILDPLLGAPIANSNFITKVKLVTGTNQVNHKLGRTLVGWIVAGKNASVDVYDAQAGNSMPDKTLTLVASAPVTLTLLVF